MTSDERDLLRGMIDAKRRDQLAKQEARISQKPVPRTAYWKAYYHANRTRILALRKARREASR